MISDIEINFVIRMVYVFLGMMIMMVLLLSPFLGLTFLIVVIFHILYYCDKNNITKLKGKK